MLRDHPAAGTSPDQPRHHAAVSAERALLAGLQGRLQHAGGALGRDRRGHIGTEPLCCRTTIADVRMHDDRLPLDPEGTAPQTTGQRRRADYWENR